MEDRIEKMEMDEVFGDNTEDLEILDLDHPDGEPERPVFSMYVPPESTAKPPSELDKICRLLQKLHVGITILIFPAMLILISFARVAAGFVERHYVRMAGVLPADLAQFGTLRLTDFIVATIASAVVYLIRLRAIYLRERGKYEMAIAIQIPSVLIALGLVIPFLVYLAIAIAS
jgi:hypothetical protein